MALENKLGIRSSAELADAEERLSKKRAAEMFDNGLLESLEAGTFDALRAIHLHLFGDIYDFAGEMRAVDWSKVGKEDYLLAMERSPVRDTEIKSLLASALTDAIDSRGVFMKGLDASYAYEGYESYSASDL